MKKMISLFVLLCGLASPSFALYLMSDLTLSLLNNSDQSVMVDVTWVHGSSWFNPYRSQPMQWKNVKVLPGQKASSQQEVWLFDQVGAHYWIIKVHNKSGILLAEFSGMNQNLLEPQFTSHQIGLTVNEGGCSVTLMRNNEATEYASPDSTVCQAGKYIPPKVEEDGSSSTDQPLAEKEGA